MAVKVPLVRDSTTNLAVELSTSDTIAKTSVGLGNVDNTSDVNKPVSTPQQTALDALIPTGYIDGLKMVWVSGTALTVTSGAAYVPSLSKVLRASSDIAKTGLSLTASTWYHVYLYSNAGTPDIELSTTTPAAAYSGTARTKTGDTSRRYVGSVRSNPSSLLHKFNHEESAGIVTYLVTVNTASLTLLSGGVSTSDVTVSAAGAAPITSRSAICLLENAGSGGVTLIGNADVGSPVAANFVLYLRPGGLAYMGVPLTSSQNFAYVVTGASSLSAYCTGYRYER